MPPPLLAFLKFEYPGYLVLLALVPLLIVLSFRSLAGLGRARRILAILMRCAVVVAMILALAGAQRVKRTDALSVVYLIDRSASIPRDLQSGEFDLLKRGIEKLRATKDRVGVIGFNGVSAIEQLPMGALAIDRLSDPPLQDQTNLAAALRTALALFTDDSARRIVVVSDGNENAGEALEEADRCAAANVPIDIVPLRYHFENEVLFDRLSAPPTASAEETINLRMVLRSRKAVGGKITLYHNDQIVDLDPNGPGAGYPVTLDAGPNSFTIPVPLRVAGAHRFRAVFEPDNAAEDTVTANNEGRAFTVVSGQGRILILTTERDEASAHLLARALESEKLVCDVEIAGSNSLDQVRLIEYSLVILSNVPASDLTEEAQRGLALYVRDLGGGLAMVGGDESFGAGGWLGSPVEEVMPVSFDVKSKKQIPKGALVLVMHASEIPEGNYWGERVAVAAVKTLSSRDLAGILSYQWQGAESTYWVAPLQEVGTKTAIIQQIIRMNMGDMPDFDAVMSPGVDALAARKDAAARHMIVISDFDPAGPTDSLLAKMKANNISCSTVAIGYGGHAIDVNKARHVADYTGGKFYTTQDYSQLPQIFIKESRIVRRALINETPFVPRVFDALSPVIPGMAGEATPPLGGYVLSTAKPLASVPLIRPTEDGNDPILAHWQAGLGKTVVFTSGMWNRWGTDWAAWPRFSKVWAQIARWASRQTPSAAFDVSTSVQGGVAKLRIDALDKNADAINFMNIEGSLVTPPPRYDSRRLQLTQTGPGRYEASFDAREAGSYVINLAYRMGTGKDTVSGNLQTGVSVAFSPEYKELSANEAFLAELASRSGGRILTPNEVARTFDFANLPRAENRSAIWEDLVRWMLLLFLIDVAIRRIAIHPLELVRRLRRFIGEIAGGRQPAEQSAAVLSTLKGTRDKLREATPPPDAGPAPTRSARYEARQTEAGATQDLSKALGGASETDAPVVARPTGKKPAISEGEYASRLLKAKRRAQDDIEREKQ
ncbi:MAG: VWA domain-containing protein [Phycisphaerae bacterium]